jgi:hypothetical protein
MVFPRAKEVEDIGLTNQPWEAMTHLVLSASFAFYSIWARRRPLSWVNNFGSEVPNRTLDLNVLPEYQFTGLFKVLSKYRTGLPLSFFVKVFVDYLFVYNISFQHTSMIEI